MPKIQVTFDIDVNGILNVSAKDEATGKSQKITIQGHGGLSDAEIQRMVAEAEANAADDRQRQELIEARNAADQLVYNAEKTLKDLGDKVDGAKAAGVRTQIEQVQAAMGREDTAAIRRETEALQHSLMDVGAEMYKGADGADAAAGTGPAEGTPSEPDAAAGGGAGVVDAEYDVKGGS